MLSVYDVMPQEFRDGLNDSMVTDLAIRDSGVGYVTGFGKHQEVGNQADNVEAMLCLAAYHAGTVINEEHPTFEGRLPNGERVVGKRPEVGGHWTITIRRPIGRRLTWRELIEYGTLTEETADWLESQVAEGKSGIIVGGMGSGKTTLLNTLLGSSSLAAKVTVKLEAVEEIIGPPICTTYLIGPHCSMKTAREKALRESAKVFIVGEARGGEEMKEVLTTMGTGHQSFTTLHADNLDEAPARIEDMLRQTTDNRTQEQIHEAIVRNVDFCVFMKEAERGVRVVSDVALLKMENGKAVKVPVHLPLV